MSGRDGLLEFEDFKKRVSWRLTLDHVGRRLSSLPLGQRVEFSTVAAAVKIFRSLQRKILNTTRCAVRWDGVSILRIVSLSSCRRTEVRTVCTWTTESACFRLHLFLHMYYVFEDVFVVPLLLISLWLRVVCNTKTFVAFYVVLTSFILLK